MDSMGGRLSAILSVFSLVLLVTTAAVWCRSYFVEDLFWYRRTEIQNRQANWFAICLGPGYVGFYRTRYQFRRTEATEAFKRHMAGVGFGAEGISHQRPSPKDKVDDVGGLAHFRFRFRYPTRAGAPSVCTHRSAELPYWTVVLLSGILPFRKAFAAARRRKRRKTRCCILCGYDLRGSTGRCPECGNEPPDGSEVR